MLNQFDSWAAFIHIINPSSEWKKLDQELFIQREELLASLEDAWTQCLVDSDPEHSFANPYVRRDRNNKLHTSALNLAIKNYEAQIEALWQAHRKTLKDQTQDKIEEGSINAQRCSYLEGVLLSDLLPINKLTIRQNKIEQAQEKQRRNRYLESGLDVNGAMLAFSDAPKKQYKEDYARNQLQLLTQDLYHEIQRSSLSKDIKSLLLKRLEEIDSVFQLELVIFDYNRWLGDEFWGGVKNWFPKQYYAEKFRIQPIIIELIRLYTCLGREESDGLKAIKQIYLDDAVFRVVYQMEMSLSWSLERNRGLGFWLERTAVKKAAEELLNASEELLSVKDDQSRKKRFEKSL